MAKEKPLEILRQTLARYDNNALLRNIREALVPDAVAPSTWGTWWKEAKKQALLDPRFEVEHGRDPRIRFRDLAHTDFTTQVERALKGAATAEGRQKAVRDLMGVVGGDEEARRVLAEAVERELALTKHPADRVGWELLRADLTGGDPVAGLAEALALAADPVSVVRAIEDDETRGRAARALARVPEDGPERLLSLAMTDDPAAADAAREAFREGGRPELFEKLLDAVDERPAQLPNLYAWFVRGLRRRRWSGRDYEPLGLILRVLKVLDAVEYRARRKEGAADRKAVARLNDLLLEKSCALLQEAAAHVDDTSAHHLVEMIGQNRGLKARARQKLQAVVLRSHPNALREVAVATDKGADEPPAQHQIYMTADGLARLRAEYERLVNEALPSNAAEIARAREFGDLSENAEYHAAREKQSLLQAKADALKVDLTRAVVIKPDIVRVDAVSVGSRVRLRDASGRELTYTLFGPPDADVGRGVINYLTPLGQALMGQAAGDHVRLDIDGEVRELEVLGVENGLA
jgi:transcription elongation factor GreA